MKKTKERKNKKFIIITICALVLIAGIVTATIILTKKLDGQEQLSGTVVDVDAKYKKIKNAIIKWDSSEKDHEKPMIKETAKCSIALNNEVYNYEDISKCWIDANTKYKNKGELEFTLYADWIAEDNGIFGEDENSYINGKGGLLIKNWTSKLIINFNGYKIDRNISGETVSYGSVIKIDESKNVYFSNGYITGGANTDDGAGVLIYGKSHVHFENMTISGNISGNNGGGIYVGSHAYLYLNNTAIQGNYADHFGGGVYCDYKVGSAAQGNRINEAKNVVTIKNNYATKNLEDLALKGKADDGAHFENVNLSEGSSIYVAIVNSYNGFLPVITGSDMNHDNDKYFHASDSNCALDDYIYYEKDAFGIKCED